MISEKINFYCRSKNGTIGGMKDNHQVFFELMLVKVSNKNGKSINKYTVFGVLPLQCLCVKPKATGGVRTTATEDNFPLGQLPFGQLSPRQLPPRKIAPE